MRNFARDSRLGLAVSHHLTISQKATIGRGSVLKECCVCGKQFSAPPTGNKTCSRVCMKVVLSEANKTHGDSYSRLYGIWCGIKSRCGVHPYYLHVSVCPEWLSFRTFREWAHNNGYSDTLEIDRIDGDGDYCPENCRWVDHSQQSQNTRCRRVANKTSRFKGVQLLASNTKNPWRACITVGGKPRHLGCFPTEEQAAQRYDEEAAKLFGEFARLNFREAGGVPS